MNTKNSDATNSTAGKPYPDHGRQPATVKGKGFASLRPSLRYALDGCRQSVGMNRIATAGKTMPSGNPHDDVRTSAANDRAFIRDACHLLQRMGYSPTVSGHHINAKKKIT